MAGWVWVTMPNGEKKLFKNNNQYKNKKMNKDNSYHLTKNETEKLYSPLTPDFHSHAYETEKYSYSCPSCGNKIKKSDHRCSKCNVMIDWF